MCADAQIQPIGSVELRREFEKEIARRCSKKAAKRTGVGIVAIREERLQSDRLGTAKYDRRVCGFYTRFDWTPLLRLRNWPRMSRLVKPIMYPP
jgi:hypothetical protein